MQHSEAFQRLINLGDELGRIRTAIEVGNSTVLQSCQRYFARPGERMTKDDVYKLLRSQDVRCPICLVSLEITKWCIDHDHVTELVRGLICATCNARLIKDTEAKILRTAAHISGNTRRVLDAQV